MSRFDITDVLRPVRRRPLRRLPALAARSMRMLWTAAPRTFAIAATLQAIAGAGVAVQLLAGQRVLAHVLVPDTGFADVAPLLALLAAVTGFVAFANVGRVEQQRLLSELVGRYATDQVLDVASRVELLAYETPGFHDRLQRAKVNAIARPVNVANGVVGLLSSGFAIAGIGAALFMMQPLFLALVVVAYVPSWVASVQASRALHRYAVEQTERDRRRAYLLSLLTGKQEAQEVRAFNLGAFLRAQHTRLFDERIADLRRVVARRLRLGFMGAFASSALTAGAVAGLVWMVVSGRMTVASAGAAAGAVVLLGQRLQAIAGAAASLYEGSLFLEDFTSFVDASSEVVAQPSGAPDVLPKRFEHAAVRDVCFTYPSRSTPTLRNVSLDLRAGEVVALVGENGSGKTTLAKLLAGLLPPDDGVIAWDGIDLSGAVAREVRDRVAVVFQDFLRYHLTAGENVSLGRHERHADRGAMVAAARRADAHDIISALDAGYDTRMGPHYLGGSELSMGQWQRVALARAFFRDAPFVILDEPSASLDPRAEEALFSDIRALCEGRSVLLITHRLSSVRTADRIYVLSVGQVVEQGTHDQLLAADGHYAELFRMQAARYHETAAAGQPS